MEQPLPYINLETISGRSKMARSDSTSHESALCMSQDKHFIFKRYLYALSGRSWRMVWMRLSQGKIPYNMGFSKHGLCQTATLVAALKITTCGLANKHGLSLCLVHPPYTPRGGRRPHFIHPESCCFCRLGLQSLQTHIVI